MNRISEEPRWDEERNTESRLKKKVYNVPREEKFILMQTILFCVYALNVFNILITLLVGCCVFL